jgi:glycosyltransferase involved in cell wall biosynthesis
MSEPLVSIVTGSLNSGKTIRDTIESVYNQTYSNIEYTIVDGKSTDKTLEIAQTYNEAFKLKNIKYTVISEKDNGLYDAMNKGILRSGGAIVGIVNSDDWYETDAIEKVVEEYKRTKFELLFGDVRIHNNGKIFIKKSKLSKWVTSRYWNHPTSFVAKSVYDEKLYACDNIYDDFDMYIRMRKEKRNIIVLNEVMSNFRMGGRSNKKTISQAWKRAMTRYKVYRKNNYNRIYIFECFFIEFGKYLLTRQG